MSTQPRYQAELRTAPTRDRTQRHYRGTLRALTGLLFSTLVLLPGCGWGNKNNQPTAVNSALGTGNWLCEAGKAAEDWDCIQSEDIQPRLKALESRTETQPVDSIAPQQSAPLAPPLPAAPLPSAPNPAATLPSASPSVLPTAAPPPPNSSDTSTPAPDTAAPAPLSNAPTGQNSLTTATPERAQEPAYAQLAYRPERSVRIIDLPKNFYAAQLLAVSTKKQIEDFVIAENLYNMSAARIARNDRVLYVLLMGVYQSKEIAEQAVALMPQKVLSMEPWIRPIGGLQNAMIRGDQLAATAGIQ